MYREICTLAYLKIESPNHGKFGKTVQLLQLYKYPDISENDLTFLKIT